MSVPEESQKPPGRGRPRSQEADRAILAATMKLLMEQGFSGLSIEAVAALAGVGKTTIYRRWPGKTEMVIAALSSFTHPEAAPNTGSLRGDLLALYAISGHGSSLHLITGPGSTLLGTVLSEKERNPKLLQTFRRLMVERRRELVKTMLDRAKARGEVRAEASDDYVLSVMIGSMLARTVAGMPVSGKAIEETIDNMLRGIMPR